MANNAGSQAGIEIREHIMVLIEACIEEHGYAPTTRQLADQLDRSTEVIRKHLNRLQEEGRLRLGPPGSRAVVIGGPD